jgi:hypothetical protein
MAVGLVRFESGAQIGPATDQTRFASFEAHRSDSVLLVPRRRRLIEVEVGNLAGPRFLDPTGDWLSPSFADVRGGARGGSDRHRRIRLAAIGSVMADRTCIRPPHVEQRSRIDLEDALKKVGLCMAHETRFELAFPSTPKASHTRRSLIARVSA